MSTAGSVLDLSLAQLALALLLVGVVITISVRQGLGIGRDLVVGSLRAVVQLYLVGLILAVVFQAAQWYWVLLILAVMTAVAAQAATSRLAKPMPHARGIAALALTVSTAVTLAYVIGAIVRVRPWYEPQYIIPIAGMILGSAMTSAALAGDRLQGDLRVRADEVEARLALGFSGREAVQPMARTALRAAMIPTVERHDDGGARAAPRHDDGADPGRLLAAFGHQVPAGRGLHAGGGHGPRLAPLRPPGGGALPHAGPPASPLSALVSPHANR
jgi:putative ABC transport system permease protein